MRVLVCFSFFVMSAFGCSADSVNPNEFEGIVELGESAIEEGRHEEAFALVLPYAEAGNPDAEFTIALLSGWGYGYGQSSEELSETIREKTSFYWLKRAASGGHEEAIRIMVDTYENGWYGQAREFVVARCWRNVMSGDERPEICVNK